MRSVSRCKTLIYILFFFIIFKVSNISAQTECDFVVDFKWNGIENYKIGNEIYPRVTFEGAVYGGDLNDLKPIYSQMIPVWDDDVEAVFNVVVTKSEPVPYDEIALLSDIDNTVPYYTYCVVNSRDNSNIYFSFIFHFLLFI